MTFDDRKGVLNAIQNADRGWIVYAADASSKRLNGFLELQEEPWVCPIESCSSFSWWSGTSPNDTENWENVPYLQNSFINRANRRTWDWEPKFGSVEQWSLGGLFSNKDLLVQRCQYPDID